MADRSVWQLVRGREVVAHLRWIQGRELLTDAPGPVGRMIESWFLQALHRVPEDEVDAQRARVFLEETLPERFAGTHVVRRRAREVPPRSQWLVALDGDRVPPFGVRDPYGWASNRWPPDMDLAWILEQSHSEGVRWARGSQGGFKAGGLCPDATEMWLTLAWCGDHYALVPRQRRRMWRAPALERHRWWAFGGLRGLWRTLERRL